MAATGIACEPQRTTGTAEERFQRLRKEARKLRPQTVGSAAEIERDALATLDTWDDTRKDANKIA